MCNGVGSGSQPRKFVKIWDLFCYHSSMEGGVYCRGYTEGGDRAGMLVNVLWCPGQPPTTTRNYPSLGSPELGNHQKHLGIAFYLRGFCVTYFMGRNERLVIGNSQVIFSCVHMQPLWEEQRWMSSNRVSRIFHLNDNQAPTTFPREPYFLIQHKHRDPEMLYLCVRSCIFCWTPFSPSQRSLPKVLASSLTNKVCRQPIFFGWDLLQNESYATFPFWRICCFILFWEFWIMLYICFSVVPSRCFLSMGF